MNAQLNNSQIGLVINIAAKHGFDITRADVKRVLESEYAQALWQEPCNCGDRIMHNNGGNYHTTLELCVANGYAVVYVSDTSESFPMDGEIFVTTTEDGWDEYLAQYEQEYDYAPTEYVVRLNQRRDMVLGLVKL